MAPSRIKNRVQLVRIEFATEILRPSNNDVRDIPRCATEIGVEHLRRCICSDPDPFYFMLEPTFTHDWDISPRQAVALQRSLVDRVVVEPLQTDIRLIAGIDVSVKDNHVRTAIVVLDMGSLSLVDSATWQGPVVFPYVPGLLSFREIPAILPALKLISVVPDAIMLDGHGLAHPRRFGLACHLGVLLDIPSLGVAKSRLTGTHKEPGMTKGDSSPLMDKEELIGTVLRTRTNVNPVFVSVGHKMELADALKLTLASTVRYKLPEPTRLAHHLSKRGKVAIVS